VTFPVKLARYTITYAEFELSAIVRQTKSSCIYSFVMHVLASKL